MDIVIHGVHHVALICANLEASLDFYCGVLGARQTGRGWGGEGRRRTGWYDGGGGACGHARGCDA
jgi:catechol 2,3-dioxygenase-like lactoylglutathione lyase family enzyme